MSENIPAEARCKEYQRRINQAMNYISEHATDNLSLADIAQQAYFSKYHFHRIFKAFAGETVAEFTRRIRLEQAANLLYLDNEQSITQIALDHGFSSAQNFAKQFTKQFGQSPSFFRRQNNRDKSLELLQQKVTGTNSKDSTTLNYQDIKVKITTLPSFELAYIRFIEPYQSMSTKRCLNALTKNIGVEQLEKSTPIGVAWDNPEITEDNKCRYDIGIVLPEGFDTPDSMSIQKFPQSLCAVYRCTIDNDDLEKPWDDLIIGWLPYSGYVLSGAPAIEMFHQLDLQDPSSNWELEICLPVKPI